MATTHEPPATTHHDDRLDDLAVADRIHERRWLTLAVLCLASFVTVLDGTIVNVALPSLSVELGFEWRLTARVALTSLATVACMAGGALELVEPPGGEPGRPIGQRHRSMGAFGRL